MQLRIPDRVKIYTEFGNGEMAAAETLSFNDVKVDMALQEDGLNVWLTANESPVRYVRLRWNFKDEEVRGEAVRVLGDEWERNYGNMEWRGIATRRCMPWVCAVSNGSDSCPDTRGRLTECFGVKVRPAALCFWQYDVQGVTLWLDVRCGGSGVLLNGRKLDVCTVCFGEYRNMTAFHALKAYYRTLCDDALTVDHKVYGSNNWYYAYGKTSQEEILSDSKVLTELCEGLENRPYMVLDDGWQLNSCDAPWDKLRDNCTDMKALADQIRQMGARPGIWFRPLADHHRLVEDMAEECRCKRDPLMLDPSHPRVLAYVKDTVNRLVCQWGYELIKHDFSTYDALGCWGNGRIAQLGDDGWCFWDRTKTSAEIMIQFYRTILEAAEGKALILGCNVIGHLAAGLTHLNRTGDDTSGVDWERVRFYGVNTLAFRMMHHEAFYLVDADCLGITESIPWELNRQWMQALYASGTPLFVSPKPADLTDLQREELRVAYACNSVQKDVLEPLDWMENSTPCVWRLNGQEIRFQWADENGPNSFAP